MAARAPRATLYPSRSPYVVMIWVPSPPWSTRAGNLASVYLGKAPPSRKSAGLLTTRDAARSDNLSPHRCTSRPATATPHPAKRNSRRGSPGDRGWGEGGVRWQAREISYNCKQGTPPSQKSDPVPNIAAAGFSPLRLMAIRPRLDCAVVRHSCGPNASPVWTC